MDAKEHLGKGIFLPPEISAPAQKIGNCSNTTLSTISPCPTPVLSETQLLAQVLELNKK